MQSRTAAVPAFDAAVMRRLVAVDPLLAYTMVRHANEPEERWLEHIFELEVRSDPALRTRYLELDSHNV